MRDFHDLDQSAPTPPERDTSCLELMVYTAVALGALYLLLRVVLWAGVSLLGAIT